MHVLPFSTRSLSPRPRFHASHVSSRLPYSLPHLALLFPRHIALIPPLPPSPPQVLFGDLKSCTSTAHATTDAARPAYVMNTLSELSNAECGEMLAKWKSHPAVEAAGGTTSGAEGWDTPYLHVLRFSLVWCVVLGAAFASVFRIFGGSSLSRGAREVSRSVPRRRWLRSTMIGLVLMSGRRAGVSAASCVAGKTYSKTGAEPCLRCSTCDKEGVKSACTQKANTVCNAGRLRWTDCHWSRCVPIGVLFC